MKNYFLFGGISIEYKESNGIFIFDTIDISGLRLMSLEHWQSVPKGSVVNGDFNCRFNNLTSLRGLPTSLWVRGNFDCSNSGLSSLSGLPKDFRLGGSFFCYGNHLNAMDIQNLPEHILAGRKIRKV